MPTRVLTIMITDIKGFTERTSSTSREDLRKLIDEHEALLLPYVDQFGGKLIKTMGDAFLVAFESPTNAVLCAVMMQEKLREYNEDRPDEEKMEVRIAINSGEVEIREDDVFGGAVNAAARIEGITEATEIYFTEAVYLAMNKAEVPTSEVGFRRFKGLPEAAKIYRVIQDRNLEKYQKLVTRLRAAAPGEIGAPSAWAAPARPARGRWKRPVAMAGGAAAFVAAAGVVLVLFGSRAERQKAAVLEAIEQGEFGVALARADRMVERYPEEKASHEAARAVVEAEARALAADGRHVEALELIDERKKARPYLETAPVEREIMLKRAGILIGKGNYAGSGPIYRELMKQYPKDVDLLMVIVEKLGSDFEGGPTSLGASAAYRVTENKAGELDGLVGRTLVDCLRREGPYGDYAANVRRVLIERYPPSVEAMKERLRSEDYEERLNAYYLLMEAERIEPDEELRCHFANLILLSSSHRKAGQESLAYLEKASGEAGWAERKKAAGIGAIEEVKVLRSWSDYQREVSGVLAGAFLPEIEPRLLEWLAGENEYLRVNARDVLRRGGRADKVDEWAFHAETLVSFDTRFIPRHFEEALEFFRAHAGKERGEDARKAVEAGRDYLLGQIKSFEQSGMKGYLKQARENLALVEAALGAFGEGGGE